MCHVDEGTLLSELGGIGWSNGVALGAGGVQQSRTTLRFLDADLKETFTSYK